ncbi:MAG: MraY family glycosyltransferase [Luteibaculaceae bacterium]
MIRWNTAKPAIGGISFFIVFLLSFTVASIIFQGESIFKSYFHLALIVTTSLAFLMGLADDAYNTQPWIKFFIQLACSIIVIAFNQHIKLFDNEIANYVITTLWIIGMMNSVNMLDNMDGITTIVAAFIIINVLTVLFISGKGTEVVFVILIGTLGSLIGFLFFNWHPSKLYMGDTGSQFLGMFLALIGIKYFWNMDLPEQQYSILKPFISVLLVFLLPLVDTTTVTINRLKRKQSPFVGGRDHTTHCLVYSGLTDSQVAFVFIGISFIAYILNLALIYFIETWTFWHSFAFGLYGVIIFVILYSLSIKHWNKYAKVK